MLSSAEIRQRFLAYFEEQGHTIVPSSSLMPGNDPTLLFSNAGMVQFKDVFLGVEQRPYSRATTSQKCMRVSGKHNDLDAVGPSPRHHTFFEMLGNFSFGDYFKPDAVRFGWTFLTEIAGLDPARLYPTVYEEDDEAFALWQEIAGLPAERITRLGKKDNFWAMGDTGPCGPCSEIIYDRGPDACTCGRPDCNLAIECDRWLELWNLVFMQYEQHEDGAMTPLPRPSIDTGMGLERITSVLQGTDNNYDTDLFMPIMRRTRELLGHDEATMRAQIVPYRVIADHARAVTFLIADGMLPGNEGRSYVLRLILRRAARFGKLLGFEQPFLAEAAQAVIDTMGGHYQELVQRAEFIRQVITQEEERFLATLNVGLQRLDELALRLRAEGSSIIPGEEAFRLYDTYGFPLELSRDAAQELGLTVDEAGFRQAMADQRERARSAQRFAIDAQGALYRQLDLANSAFLGYDALQAQATILSIIHQGESVSVAHQGQTVEITLDRTPFYGESGGQVGDTGLVTAVGGARAEVLDTVRPIPGLIVHQARLVEGQLAVGETVEASVDAERRLDIARNHTATHLLHRALRQVLGEHAAQSGSLVSPERLRFDFTHLSALSAEEIAQVEEIVNQEIRHNRAVATKTRSYEQATREGAIALFGEKYGDQVRVVSVEGFSSELCGGTHLRATGQIGSFHILAEASVGSGIRRIEAVTGRGAERFIQARLADLKRIAQEVAARPGEEATRVAALVEQLREQRQTIQALQAQLASQSVGDLIDKASEVSGVKVLAQVVEASSIDALRDMCDQFRDRLGSCLVALGAIIDEKPMIVVGLTKDLADRGLHAGKIAGAAAKAMGGGGGGRADMAQAGGRDVAGLPTAIDSVLQLVETTLR